MLRYLLLFFFFLMLAGHELGLSVNLGPGLSTKNALLYLIVIGIAINAAVVRNRKLEALSVFIPFGLLVLYAILTSVIVITILDRPAYSLWALVSLKSTLIDYFLTLAVFYYGVINRKDALWLLKWIVILVVISNGVTFVDAFNLPNLGIVDTRSSDGRFQGFMGAANDYGMLLVLFLPLSVALFRTSIGRGKLLAGVGVTLTAACLVLTGSRGAYVGAVGGLLLSAWFLRRFVSFNLVVRGAALLLIALAALIPILIFSGYSELFLDRFALFEGNAHTASSGRTTIWLKALGVMAESPLSFITGFGFASYDFSREFSAAMHNHYLHYLFNLGAIGLLLFLLVFGRILVIIRTAVPTAPPDSKPYLQALIIGLLALLLTQFFGEYSRSAYLIWACLGIALRVCMGIEVRNEADEHSTEATNASGKTDIDRLLGRPI